MRGGTEVAVGDTALSQVRQPASVVLHPVLRFDGKISSIFPINKWNGVIDGDVFTKPALPNFAVAIVGPLTERSGWGLSVFSKTGWNGKFGNFDSRYLFSSVPQNASASVLNYGAQLNFGTKVAERLYCGGGPRVELARYGSSTVYGPGKLVLGNQWSVGGGFNLGILYRLSERVMLGSGYRSPTWLGPAAKGRFELFDGTSFPARVPASQTVLPQRVMVGASWRKSEKLMVAVEGAWVNYRYSLFGHTYVDSLVPLAYPAQLKNILIGNVGADYELSRHWGVSAGYAFNTNPVPRSAILPGFTSNSQNNLTCGLRYRRKNWWAGIAYVIALPNRTSNHSNRVPPLGIDYTRASVRNIVQSITYGVGFQI